MIVLFDNDEAVDEDEDELLVVEELVETDDVEVELGGATDCEDVEVEEVGGGEVVLVLVLVVVVLWLLTA